MVGRWRAGAIVSKDTDTLTATASALRILTDGLKVERMILAFGTGQLNRDVLYRIACLEAAVATLQDDLLAGGVPS